MKLTKQDLMRLPKERLAEIIVELQEPLTLTSQPDKPTFIPFRQQPLCWEPGGHCTNPQMDYISFDPAIGFDLGGVSLYHGKDMIATSQVVDAEIVKDIHNLLHVKSAPLPMPSEYHFGDKVKIIILPDETDNR